MFFEAPLITSLSIPRSSENDEMSTKRRVGSTAGGAGAKRKRAASTSLPLRSLCLNQESSPLNVNLESLFSYLPAPSGRRNRSSWNPTSFRQFKAAASKPSSTPIHPRTTPTPIATTTLTPKTTISSLPPELLCLIFDSYSSPSFGGDNTPTSPDPSSHPYGFFSSSNDKWRATAVGHKGLWGSIAFAILGVGEGDEEASFHRWAKEKLELLKLFLARARGVPLTLALSTSEDTPRSVVGDVMNLVCRYTGQWENLRMDLGSGSAVQALRDELALTGSRRSHGTFAMMRSLQLELAVDEEEEYDDAWEEEGGGEEDRALQSRLAIRDVYAFILPRAPRLASLVLDDAFFECSEGESDAMVPWPQLRSLTITSNSISAHRVLGMCARAGGLEELKVWRLGCDIDLWDSPSSSTWSSTTDSVVSLPHLRSLELTTLTYPSHLLDRLRAPALRRVDVDVQALMGPLPVDTSDSVVSILEPLNRLLKPLSSANEVDVRCGIRKTCLPEVRHRAVPTASGSQEPTLVDVGWMEGQGLGELARAGKVEVEVYKYGSRRSVDGSGRA
ncbi:hypothetical protein FA13DRAFT_1813810 [Coprinellus micaceus]|uniref:F-box domain-containing protein n=1 Tax=Coprinellus micaceus TaxID=71717 RepID=A0A4Y7TBS1_COPMI|nr:hypothetical protein FA13DRAFT_1813810 [Coprinellus micaceus]